jgi:8-oxo-dGTP pyrophosphatase MutT (NUDIX family)
MDIAEPGELLTIPASEFRSEIVKIHRPAPQAAQDTPRIRVVTDNEEQPREPGGHVEDDESQAQAALREVTEETGLTGVWLLQVPAPALPAGFPHERVAPPWWITEQQVPADSHLREPHVHLDHQYVAVADAAEPVRPAGHPFGWYPAERLPELEMWEDTKLLAKVLFSCIDDLAAGRIDGVSALRPFTAAAAP